MYLTRAECYARKGELVLATKDINDLLRTRWKKIGTVTTYVDQSFASADEALNVIIKERRKELIFRGIRWSDLRRLNKEDRFKQTLQRSIGGQTYTLEPNSYKYALPIPDYVIQQSSIPQNPHWD
ncbi:MAG: RagB/SusD family nutrient uptake outer membrane protein, partial [Chitinophagaceae bacterium]|nr:RagB/SusD family nutrient uptake outer membrane protein [Chitinophagaceae bacterium]